MDELSLVGVDTTVTSATVGAVVSIRKAEIDSVLLAFPAESVTVIVQLE